MIEKKDQQLDGKKVAILATDGFEEDELFKPFQALVSAGAQVELLSLKSGTIRSWKDNDWGKTADVDKLVQEATSFDYDALMLPGGVINADKIRMDQAAIKFVSGFVESGKPMAVICHGAWVLIEAGGVEDRKMTSWPSLKTDLRNAGAEWVDEEVVTDDGLVTSRKPSDIPAFNEKMIEEFAEGEHGSGSSLRYAVEHRDVVH